MKIKISSFLKERLERFKPVEANNLGLKRLQKIDFYGNMHFLEDKKTNTNMILIKPGDLVISGINVEKGAVAVYQGKEDVLATIHYSSYEFDKNKIDIDYFKWFLKSDSFRKVVQSQTRGGIKTELKPKKFLPLEIDLPEIKEQKQILSKINKVENEIKELETNILHDKKLLSSLKQSILQEAVQGKLVPPVCRQARQNPKDLPADTSKYYVYVIKCSDGTLYKGFTNNLKKRYEEHEKGIGADWTRKNKPDYLIHYEIYNTKEEAIKREKFLKSGRGREELNTLIKEDKNRLWQADEPASELLKKIKREKEKLIKEGKIKKQKELPPIGEDDLSAGQAGVPYDLPRGWVWCRLGDVCEYGSSEKIESKNISPETWILDLEDIEKTTSKLLIKKRFVDYKSKSTKNVFSKGDILYGKLRPYLDKVIIADEDGVCTTEIIPLKVYNNLINNNYLRYFLKNPNFLAYVNSLTYGVKMPRLGTADGKLAPFPLPPLPEQKRIVEKVDALMKLCDELELRIKENKQYSESLMDAVLRESFEDGR